MVDPYNDFISEGGKIWPRIQAVAEANNCVPHMEQVLKAARAGKASASSSRCTTATVKATTSTGSTSPPFRKLAWNRRTFEYGTWGGEFKAEFVPAAGEVVASEHWCSSGFANTDLDNQLKRRGIHRLIVIGLIAHTCIEATVRFAAELGYDVTVVKDAVADYSDEMMHAALEINMPNYASAIVTTEEILVALAAMENMAPAA